ncbi:5'-nucleotidase, lipoprotein e(P4) family [Luteimonas sp. A478]
MQQQRPSQTLLLAPLLALVMTGCASVPAAPAPATTASADDNLNAVLWVQRSQEFETTLLSLYRGAINQLDAALADPQWDALVPAERDNPDGWHGLPPAVILDIDETVLDNSIYQARLVRDGLEYDDDTWAEWVAEQRATPVPGVLEFARAASERGVTLYYVTNREHRLKDATLANLRALGLPVAHDNVFLGLGMEVADCEQPGSRSGKLCRRQLVGRSHRVLMQFGDQLTDFAHLPVNTSQARDATVAERGGWFGERWWMLPNPTYGGWEPALFNNDWGLSREQRRTLKREALNTEN